MKNICEIVCKYFFLKIFFQKLLRTSNIFNYQISILKSKSKFTTLLKAEGYTNPGTTWYIKNTSLILNYLYLNYRRKLMGIAIKKEKNGSFMNWIIHSVRSTHGNGWKLLFFWLAAILTLIIW